MYFRSIEPQEDGTFFLIWGEDCEELGRVVCSSEKEAYEKMLSLQF